MGLIQAAINGNLKVVKYLHQNGADIRALDDHALRWSADSGHLDVVKYLHQNGADIRARDDFALLRSAKNGHLNVVKYLIENGADVDILDVKFLYDYVLEGKVKNKKLKEKIIQTPKYAYRYAKHIDKEPLQDTWIVVMDTPYEKEYLNHFEGSEI